MRAWDLLPRGSGAWGSPEPARLEAPGGEAGAAAVTWREAGGPGGASVAAAAPLGDLAGPGQAAGPREAGGGAGGGRTLELRPNH